MVTYMAIPKARVKFDDVVTDGLLTANVEMAENNYWTAQLNFSNVPALYPATVNVGTDVLIDVQDGAVGGAWSNLFTGNVLYLDYSFSGKSAVIGLQCVGLGYGLNMMNAAEEYGTQSRNPERDTIQGILTNEDAGLIPKWTELYAGGSQASGYTINTDKVENLAGGIQYISFPWKPINKCLDDLCDLHTAISASSSLAGPHWIVDNSGNLRLKRIGATQTGWTKYYGDSQENATLTSGVDFFDGDFQLVGKEANVVLYYGLWRRPSNGDAWTENSSSLWGNAVASTPDDDDVNHRVGEYSIKITETVNHAYYPSGKDAAWNFNNFSDFTVPHVSFHALKHGTPDSIVVRLYSDTSSLITNWYGYHFHSKMTDDDVWYHFNLPLGPYYKTVDDSAFEWISSGTPPDWSEINIIYFAWSGGAGDYVCIDGLHIGNVPIIRVARQEFPDEIEADRGTLGETTNPIKFKVLTDNIGKDDSLLATDDSGLMAQLAKAELLCACKPSINGKFTTPLIKDVLPGQYFYIEKDYRITEATHFIQGGEFRTAFEVTDDLTNSHTRLRYEDINKQYASIRPEYQDRQATSLKSGGMDIRILPLEKAYNI